MVCLWFVREKLYVYMGRGKHMARRPSLVVWEPGMNMVKGKKARKGPVTFFRECGPFSDSLSLLILVSSDYLHRIDLYQGHDQPPNKKVSSSSPSPRSLKGWSEVINP